MGFIRCIFDAEVFILERASEKVILSKHVDDCHLAGMRGANLLDLVSKKLTKSNSLTASIEPKNFVDLAIIMDRENKKYYRYIFCPYLYC